jgi:hypothetical protein
MAELSLKRSYAPDIKETKHMKNKFNVGDFVKVNIEEAFRWYTYIAPPDTEFGFVVGYSGPNPLVRFEGWRGGHNGNGLVDHRFSLTGDDCWFVAETSCTLVKETMKLTPTVAPAPKRLPKFARGTQLYLLLQHLSSGRTLTRITADHLYRVASLTKRIAELRAAGYDIVSTRKLDFTGRIYVEYSMRTQKAA